MKYLKSILIILTFTGVGQVLSLLIPAPVPPAIYGLALLLIALLTGLVKLEQVKAVGDLLISLMPLMFLAPSVRIMVAFSGHEGFLPAFLVISVLSLYIVMVVTGLVTQALRGGSRHE